MRLLWLPTVLREAGLTVYEVAGWQTRGGDSFDPRGGICHATAGSATSTDQGEIHTLLYGSNSAPPPIAQLYLSRSGAFHVVASGRCNHALTGQAGTPLQGLGNTNLIGIEAQNNNAGQPWPAVQIDAYIRGCAAIARKMGWSANRWIAHREHQPNGKTDPAGINMGSFRTAVAQFINDPSGGDVQLSDPSPWKTQYTWETYDPSDGPWLGGTVGDQLQHMRETVFFTKRITLRTEARMIALATALEAALTAGGGSLDMAALMAHVDEKLEALAAETRDAVADLGEGGAAQVRGPQ